MAVDTRIAVGAFTDVVVQGLLFTEAAILTGRWQTSVDQATDSANSRPNCPGRFKVNGSRTIASRAGEDQGGQSTGYPAHLCPF